MDKIIINKVAVIGSGTMGSRIACLLASVNKQVILFDLPTPNSAGNSVKDRNAIIHKNIETVTKDKLAALYQPQDINNIEIANLEDDLIKLKDCDLVIEAIIENLQIKKDLFNKIQPFLKPKVILTSNTSSILINELNNELPETLRKNFCGTHFFNPPRYLKLLEIIPSAETSAEILESLVQFGTKILGKTVVICQDTPGFIANRIITYATLKIFEIMDQDNLSIEEIDLFTGQLIGHPKSATFRTLDIVGIDVFNFVQQTILSNPITNTQHEVLQVPSWLNTLITNKWLGDKTGQGFYKKSKNEKGQNDFFTIDLKSFEYHPKKKIKIDSVPIIKGIEDTAERLKQIFKLEDSLGIFFKKFHLALFSYISFKLSEITKDIFQFDNAIKAGFDWEYGPFEIWELLGVEKVVDLMKKHNIDYAPWVDVFLQNNSRFYQYSNGIKSCYNLSLAAYLPIESEKNIIGFNAGQNKILWQNSACLLMNIGDGVNLLSWKTKMNTMGAEVIEGINKSIDLTEKNYEGLILANNGANFSAGANLGLIFMLASNQEYDELEIAIRTFQKTMMRLRYSSIPVIACPHNLCLGGGTELCLHADSVFTSAETYMGLVELGVGVIPGGGGTKEFVLRAAKETKPFDVDTTSLRTRFMTIAQAKVATSAKEAFNLGYLENFKDQIIYSFNNRINLAKKQILLWQDKGYSMPLYQNKIPVLGKSALGLFEMGILDMLEGGYASEHDAKIARKLAYVMCGGDLSEKQLVSEQYLLDLERQAFLSLCGERKTLERMQSVLTSGKPIRN